MISRVSILLLALLWVLCFGSVSVLAFDPEPVPEENTEVVELEEGVYQVYEDESYSESGDVDVTSVDESSTGSNNGEIDNSGSGDEQTTESGDNDVNAGSSETTEGSTEEVEDDRLNTVIEKVDTLHDDFLKLLISIWVLAGLYLGTKLIKGLFGYYG